MGSWVTTPPISCFPESQDGVANRNRVYLPNSVGFSCFSKTEHLPEGNCIKIYLKYVN